MKSILDPTFRYVPSASTDLRKTFARIKRERVRCAAEMAKGVGPARVFELLAAKKAVQLG